MSRMTPLTSQAAALTMDLVGNGAGTAELPDVDGDLLLQSQGSAYINFLLLSMG